MCDNFGKYIVICPVRNEAKYIGDTLLSIVSQTIKPVEMIVVDDSSDDSTCKIVQQYQRLYPWIKLIHIKKNNTRALGGRVVENFYAGFDNITTEYEYIVKMDGDLSFPKNYFEFLIYEFNKNKKLGMAGGITYSRLNNELRIEHSQPSFNVPGPLKMYRKACFNAIGGLDPMLGWDHIDQMKAQMKGWKTWNYRELKIIHHRPMGSSIENLSKGKARWGETAYILRNDILFVIAKGLYHMFQRPYLIGGLCFYIGYLNAVFREKKRLPDIALSRYMRGRQRRRLFKIQCKK